MRFLGQLNDGVYADPMDNIHPDIIERYYGVDGIERIRRPGETGAGHPEDEDMEQPEQRVDEPVLSNTVADDLAHNVRHPPIKVARHGNPFRSPVVEKNFFAALGAIVQADIIPEGYGVLESEWEDGTYPAMEAINPGTRGKEIIVALPRDVWLPRAILFAQGLDAMTRSLVFEEAELGHEEVGDLRDDLSSSSQEDIV